MKGREGDGRGNGRKVDKTSAACCPITSTEDVDKGWKKTKSFDDKNEKERNTIKKTHGANNTQRTKMDSLTF